CVEDRRIRALPPEREALEPLRVRDLLLPVVAPRDNLEIDVDHVAVGDRGLAAGRMSGLPPVAASGRDDGGRPSGPILRRGVLLGPWAGWAVGLRDAAPLERSHPPRP